MSELITITPKIDGTAEERDSWNALVCYNAKWVSIHMDGLVHRLDIHKFNTNPGITLEGTGFVANVKAARRQLELICGLIGIDND